MNRFLMLIPFLFTSLPASGDGFISNVRGEGAGSAGGWFGLWWIAALAVWVIFHFIKKAKDRREPTLEERMEKYRKEADRRAAEEEQEQR